jgi:hypothetical protein
MPCQTQAHRLLLSGILTRYPGSSLFIVLSRRQAGGFRARGCVHGKPYA